MANFVHIHEKKKVLSEITLLNPQKMGISYKHVNQINLHHSEKDASVGNPL